MKYKLVFIVCFLLNVLFAQAQKDTSHKKDLYSNIDYAEMFDELESFIDSLTRPRSFSMVNVGVSNRLYQYFATSSSNILVDKSITLSPSIGYYNKNGLGINVGASVVQEVKKWNPYQFSATASYDYLKNTNLLTGISYTRYFTKDTLSFYTSPLQNELFAHFTYRRSFIKPSISASYGWGSRSAIEERKWQLGSLIKEKKEKKKKNNGNGNGNGNNNGRGNDLLDFLEIVERLNSVESIKDLNVSLTFRHDFYWLDVFVSDDFVRFTPQIAFTGGTQNYGFNQSLNYTANKRNIKGDLLSLQQNYSLDEKIKFQPLSLTAFLKTEFSLGKFFLQPQMMFDYYFPASDEKFTTNFVVNSGFMF